MRRNIEKPPADLLEAVEIVAREQLTVRNPMAVAQDVRRVSLAYRREQGSPAELRDRAALAARLLFFVPRDWAKVELPLGELLALGALPDKRALRILDLGAGLGTTGLGAACFLLRTGAAEHVHVDAVDADGDALAVAEKLAARIAKARNSAISWRAEHATVDRLLATARLRDRYDLVLLGLVLNEVAESNPATAAEAQLDVLQRCAALLSPGGAVIAIEPALREASRRLQGTRDQLVAAGSAPYVVGPCLHARACPLLERERDWCHERIAMELPPLQAELARAAGLRDEDLTFSYLTLSNEPRSLRELAAVPRGYRVVGGPLLSKGKTETLVCGTDATRVLRRLDRHRSEHNAALDDAGRGCLLALPGTQPEPAEVLRVDADSQVLRVLG